GMSWRSMHRGQPGRVDAVWHHHKATIELATVPVDRQYPAVDREPRVGSGAPGQCARRASRLGAALTPMQPRLAVPDIDETPRALAPDGESALAARAGRRERAAVPGTQPRCGQDRRIDQHAVLNA